MHHAIPTTYNGVNFRSRLEAKYAAMFDQLEWKWEYEPVDMNGWIPDFVIKGIRPIYVEVKPVWDIIEAEIVGKTIFAKELHRQGPVEVGVLAQTFERHDAANACDEIAREPS